LIDLGTHDHTYNGKTSEAHKILLVWELTAEKMTSGETFLVARDFTWSLNKKAKLREFLEGWLGRAIADGEELDLDMMVGRPCVVNLSEGVSGAGKKFVEVAGCGPPLRGLTIPPATVRPILYCLAEQTSCSDDPPNPERVPFLYGRRVADEIKNSKEWAKLPPF
jgi:hypothetical protein